MNKYIVLILSVLLISCKKDDVTFSSVDDDIEAWLDMMKILATRDDSGIYYYSDIVNPTGIQASNGSVVAIYYTLKDINGSVIASHQQSDGDSLIFKIGTSAVYPVGLDLIEIMRIGEVYNFILPPEQAYSGLTSETIKPDLIAFIKVQLVGVFNENDVFAGEVVDINDYITVNNLNDINIKPLDHVEFFPASGIASKRLRAGVGSLPLINDTVKVSYTGEFLSDKIFGSDAEFEWIVGSGKPRQLISGFEFGVSRMLKDEEILLFIPSSQAYRESALVIPDFITDDLVKKLIIPNYVTNIPPYSTLKFKITRVD